jgi:BirA family biotin operon repressor/biotin-[acetyl-CoA-carboxylase] ligase
MSAARQGEAALSGWRLQIHDVLPSTSDCCRERAAAGEAGGLAILALRQTKGRGSRGRSWESPAGNLSLSVLLRPAETARGAAQWSLLAGVALAESLAAYLPDPSALRLKWPNDVLLGDSKLAGILVDSSADPAGMLDWLVIGMGANLSTAPLVPGRAVACVADLAAPPDAGQLAESILARLTHWHAVRASEGFEPIRAAWLARAPTPGMPVTFRLGEEVIRGAFAGLDVDGGLLLQTAEAVRTFTTGEVLLS